MNSKLVLSSALCLSLVLPVVALAEYTVADLSGGYALDANIENEIHPRHGEVWSACFVATFVADGQGGIVGSRTVLHPVTPSGVYHATIGFLEQSFTGTYQVTPDGRVTATITGDPLPSFGAAACWDCSVASETWLLSLSQGGSALQGVVVATAECVHETCGITPSPNWAKRVVPARGASQAPCSGTYPSASPAAGPGSRLRMR